MYSIGVDIVEVGRIAQAVSRWGERFLHRVYTDGEIAYCGTRMSSLAARWAAKEAVSKALGTGWAPQEAHEAGWIDWTEIEVVRRNSGQPEVLLHGKARARAEHLGIAGWQISISHTHEHAVAMVLSWRAPA
ncbi:MAG: holo-ACP synthase [Caldilineae bacterium]|nr:holo-ACP synthase [Anaerolineae bacterium]MCB0205895.1 holo-ACP synthase [Anaerolineae bacterium]MCB0255642.1 holo-ACP synthase [Anaerolineae bacterium]MCB9153664.1 holo-ACP synthase [Caldilineae bacterium]